MPVKTYLNANGMMLDSWVRCAATTPRWLSAFNKAPKKGCSGGELNIYPDLGWVRHQCEQLRKQCKGHPSSKWPRFDS